jgi:hypothetical protein
MTDIPENHADTTSIRHPVSLLARVINTGYVIDRNAALFPISLSD